MESSNEIAECEDLLNIQLAVRQSLLDDGHPNSDSAIRDATQEIYRLNERIDQLRSGQTGSGGAMGGQGSRKRDRDQEALDIAPRHSKSRRTDNLSAFGSASSSNQRNPRDVRNEPAQNAVSDDVLWASLDRAREVQRRVERENKRKQEQERRDHRMAMELSATQSAARSFAMDGDSFTERLSSSHSARRGSASSGRSSGCIEFVGSRPVSSINRNSIDRNTGVRNTTTAHDSSMEHGSGVRNSIDRNNGSSIARSSSRDRGSSIVRSSSIANTPIAFRSPAAERTPGALRNPNTSHPSPSMSYSGSNLNLPTPSVGSGSYAIIGPTSSTGYGGSNMNHPIPGIYSSFNINCPPFSPVGRKTITLGAHNLASSGRSNNATDSRSLESLIGRKPSSGVSIFSLDNRPNNSTIERIGSPSIGGRSSSSSDIGGHNTAIISGRNNSNNNVIVLSSSPSIDRASVVGRNSNNTAGHSSNLTANAGTANINRPSSAGRNTSNNVYGANTGRSTSHNVHGANAGRRTPNIDNNAGRTIVDLTSPSNVTASLPGRFPEDTPGFTSARSLLGKPQGADNDGLFYSEDDDYDDDKYFRMLMGYEPWDTPDPVVEPDHYNDMHPGTFRGDPMNRSSKMDITNLLSNITTDDIVHREGTPDGLGPELYPHQQVALAWMKKAEEGTNKGGILADDMGLGKTLSTTALILSRPPPEGQSKTNLIVGPVALMRQWEEELRDKVRDSHQLKVFVAHGSSKASIETLLEHDVVLTTYGTISSQKKQLNIFRGTPEGQDWDHPFYSTKCPLLHPKKATFWRVILDEAQNIKNQNTKQAIACSTLLAENRWCLTGTPMMNNVSELYSLIRFLRIRPYNEHRQFMTEFKSLWDNSGNSTTRAVTKLRALLKAIMLRRLKTTVVDGKPILQLPPKEEHIVYATMSEDEKAYYDQLQQMSRVQFGKYLRAGTVGKNYSNILVLLLRLRQTCCHPHLNLDLEEKPDSADAREQVELAEALDAKVVKRIKEKSKTDLECPICYDVVQTPLIMTPCGHYACKECMSSLQDMAERRRQQAEREGNTNQANIRGIDCPYCKVPVNLEKSIPYNIFQYVHMASDDEKEESSDEEPVQKRTRERRKAKQKAQKKEQGEEEDDDEDSDYDNSDSDGDGDDDDEMDKYGNLEGFMEPDEEEVKFYSKLVKHRTAKAVEKEDKAKQAKRAEKYGIIGGGIRASELKELRGESARNTDAKKRYFGYLDNNWLSSAKVDQCVSLLRQFVEAGEKAIVFSQWTSLLDLLEVAIRRGGSDLGGERMCRYDGSMSATARNESAHRFRDSRSTEKIMLVSLKAGNAGLNLVAASRVIIMDPFWNPYVEMQAVDRAYRIGQHKDVHVYRILVKDSVEDRIVKLQEKKRELVESALDEDGGKAISRLSTEELKFMFGL